MRFSQTFSMLLFVWTQRGLPGSLLDRTADELSSVFGARRDLFSYNGISLRSRWRLDFGLQGPHWCRFVAPALLRRNHFCGYNEAGRSIWRSEMGARHRLSLKASRRMAFYFPNLHETLRNHKGPISPEEAVVRLHQSRWLRIDRPHQWAGGTAFTSRPLSSVICVTVPFDWLHSDHFPFSSWILRSPDCIPQLRRPPHPVFVLRTPDGICPHICIVRTERPNDPRGMLRHPGKSRQIKPNPLLFMAPINVRYIQSNNSSGEHAFPRPCDGSSR